MWWVTNVVLKYNIAYPKRKLLVRSVGIEIKLIVLHFHTFGVFAIRKKKFEIERVIPSRNQQGSNVRMSPSCPSLGVGHLTSILETFWGHLEYSVKF